MVVIWKNISKGSIQLIIEFPRLSITGKLLEPFIDFLPQVFMPWSDPVRIFQAEEFSDLFSAKSFETSIFLHRPKILQNQHLSQDRKNDLMEAGLSRLAHQVRQNIRYAIFTDCWLPATDLENWLERTPIV